MKRILVLMLAMTLMTLASGCKKVEPPKSAEAPKVVEALAPTAGGTVVGVTVTEIVNVASGWSAKKQIMEHAVYNDKNEKVGEVYDIIIAPDKAVSYGIIAAGGFLGIGKHDVAIPINQFRMQDGRIILPGATKDAIKAMPQFKYAK